MDMEENHRQPEPEPEPRDDDQPPLNQHQLPIPIACPRCNSSDTKFCYYNNYNLSQPRYFCKTCRRYWTKGGALRNIPVGGASRPPRNRKTTTTKLRPKRTPNINKTTTAQMQHEISVPSVESQADDCGVGVGTTSTFSSPLASYPDPYGGLSLSSFLADTYTDTDHIHRGAGGGGTTEALCIWPHSTSNSNNSNSWAESDHLSIYTPAPSFL